MKKRLTDWMDDLPVQYLDELEQAGQKKGCYRGYAAAACFAALLAVMLNWEPLAAKANEIFLKSRIFYNGPEEYVDGTMEVPELVLPDDMERICSQVAVWKAEEGKERMIRETGGYQETGLRKVYGSLEELQEDLQLCIIPEELNGLAGKELWFTYYDTSRDKEAIVDMSLNIPEQDEPVYLEVNMVLGTKKERPFVDIGKVYDGGFGGIKKELDNGKTYLVYSYKGPHYQMITETTDDPSENISIYHQAQKMMTPEYREQAVFFLNGMRYCLFGIETEEIAEGLVNVFLETH